MTTINEAQGRHGEVPASPASQGALSEHGKAPAEHPPAGKKPLGIYLHIPFCLRKCYYCDFSSFSGSSGEERKAYVRALLREIEGYGSQGSGEQKREEDSSVCLRGFCADTVFFGGGTPSLLDPGSIAEILDVLDKNLGISSDAEITLEANPGTLSQDSLNGYRSAGINRISLGVQSLDDRILHRLGRIHDRRVALKSVAMIRQAGFDNVNLDLMFGIPGQSLESWLSTLEEALVLQPEHLSFYSLQIEEGTKFYRWMEEGTLEPLPEETDRAMYHQALQRMEEKGYLHYEISNAARREYACRHNLKYWTMEDYLGLGLSAHSFIRGVRFFNTSDADQYLQGRHLEEMRENSRWDTITDHLFMGLRLISGISERDFKTRYSHSLEELFGEEIGKFIQQGLLKRQDGRLAFTKIGLDYTNAVLRELMTAGGTYE